MKTLDELGISPAPWKVCREWNPSVVKSGSMTVCSQCNTADARLIAAAPDLYEALREAVYEYCCDDICPNGCSGECTEQPGKCFVQEWRAVLAKAAGEEVVKCN